MFPLYSETRKGDVVTDNYLYPFSRVRHGDGLEGLEILADCRARTQGCDDEDERVWRRGDRARGMTAVLFCGRFISKNWPGIGTDNPEKSVAVLPLYSRCVRRTGM